MRSTFVRSVSLLAVVGFLAACDGDVGASCRRVAIQYRWGQGVEPDWIASERLFRRACKLGVGEACWYL